MVYPAHWSRVYIPQIMTTTQNMVKKSPNRPVGAEKVTAISCNVFMVLVRLLLELVLLENLPRLREFRQSELQDQAS